MTDAQGNSNRAAVVEKMARAMPFSWSLEDASAALAALGWPEERTIAEAAKDPKEAERLANEFSGIKPKKRRAKR